MRSWCTILLCHNDILNPKEIGIFLFSSVTKQPIMVLISSSILICTVKCVWLLIMMAHDFLREEGANIKLNRVVYAFLLLGVAISSYLFYQYENNSIEEAISYTVIVGTAMTGYLIAIIRPDFFISLFRNKTVTSVEAWWLIRIPGVVIFIWGIYWIYMKWQMFIRLNV